MKIFLIGFMGCGKSYRGHQWAQGLNLEFIDMDARIEWEEGLTAEQIFTEKGEPYFRQKETEILQILIHQENILVACGGGTPCFNDNMSLMNEHGTTVYLRSSPEKLYERLIHERHKRPLIKGLTETELLFYIKEKIEEREFYYMQAQHFLNVDELPDDFIPTFDHA